MQLLVNAPIARGNGETVLLWKKQFQNMPAPLIVYMDTAAKELALSHKFLYLPSFSAEDRLMFADATYGVYVYSNGVDVYGFEKTEDGATKKITLASITDRSQKDAPGNYGALFLDLVKDLIPLFPNVDISIPLTSLDKNAHIEIGKRDQFYSAGIVVVPRVTEDILAHYSNMAITYAKIDRNSLGVITDGYTFRVWTENNATGMLTEEEFDYAHFVGKLISELRFRF